MCVCVCIYISEPVSATVRREGRRMRQTMDTLGRRAVEARSEHQIAFGAEAVERDAARWPSG